MYSRFLCLFIFAQNTNEQKGTFLLQCKHWKLREREIFKMALRQIFITIAAVMLTSAVFADSASVTSKKYVDDLMTGYQDKIPGSGNNKLMIYDESPDGIGEKNIVSSLGVSTSATDIPNVGAVKDALDDKQDKFNGTAGYVMTGTGNAGSVGQKPIYSVSTNYPDALVTAETVNTGVINAVNSSLIRVDANGDADPNGTLWRIADDITALNTLPYYTELEWVSGGVIDTGLYLKTTDIFEFKYAVTEPQTAYQFGYRGSTGYSSANTFNGTYTGATAAVLWVVDNGGNARSFEFSTPIDSPIVFRWNGSVNTNPTVNGAQISGSGSTAEQTNPTQTFIFGGQNIAGQISDHKVKKLYYFKTFASDGVTMTHNFVAARRDSDAALGMYDTITGVFLVSAKGTFTAGPVASAGN